MDHEEVEKKIMEINTSDIMKNISDRNSKIVEVTGSGTFISAAKAIVDHIRDLFYGSLQIVSKGVIVQKSQYGVEEGICFSMPLVCHGNGEYAVLDDLTIKENQKNRIKDCVQELLKEKELVKNFLTESENP